MSTMKLQTFVLAALCCGLSSYVLADVNMTGSGGSLVQPPVFGGDMTPLGEDMSFHYDSSADQSSLGTCTMNPTSGKFSDAIIAEMPVARTESHVAIQDYSYSLARPTRTLLPPENPQRYYRRNLGDPELPADGEIGDNGGEAPPPESSSVPEPATLLIFGLGMIGIAPFARRFRPVA